MIALTALAMKGRVLALRKKGMYVYYVSIHPVLLELTAIT